MSPDSPYYMEHFVVQELVDPMMYAKFGDDAIRYVDPRLIANLNAIREYLGEPMVINNWHVGGDRTQSGIRSWQSKYYSQYSAHSFGQAIDAVGDWSAYDLRMDIVDEEVVLPYPSRLENGVNWFHMDTMNTGEVDHVITF